MINKEALRTEKIQTTQTAQVGRQPSAVIVKGNPKYITGNHHAAKFYNTLADVVRSQGYTVQFDPGEPYTSPPNADVWLGHSRGIDRLRFAPKGTKTISIGGLAHNPGVINHPLDHPQIGVTPNIFHYQITNKMRGQIVDKLKKKK